MVINAPCTKAEPILSGRSPASADSGLCVYCSRAQHRPAACFEMGPRGLRNRQPPTTVRKSRSSSTRGHKGHPLGSAIFNFFSTWQQRERREPEATEGGPLQDPIQHQTPRTWVPVHAQPDNRHGPQAYAKAPGLPDKPNARALCSVRSAATSHQEILHPPATINPSFSPCVFQTETYHEGIETP